MRRLLLGLALTLLGSAAAAQNETAMFTFGGDRFLAGDTVTLTSEGTDDLFIAGETVRASADIAGSAHAAGRRVSLDAAIGRDAYAAGMDVTLSGPVTGDASLAGYDIVVGGTVGGDLRASGSKVTINAPVAGYALLAGELVTLNSVISGDVSVTGPGLVFGPDARIDGNLTLYEPEENQTEVPGQVVPADRVERIPVEDWRKGDWKIPRVFDWRGAVLSFVGGVIAVAAIAALIAAVAPRRLARMRVRTLDAPFRSLWFGFLAQSTLVGSAIISAMTVIGLLLVPASIFLAVVGGFLGYVIGAYTFGVGLLLAFGRGEPGTMGERALAAAIGALLAGLIGLIPFLGWLFVLALTLAGVGAITVHVFRPAFFATD